jgi:ribosomal protein S18 acetylase RimI-like enzyme
MDIGLEMKKEIAFFNALVESLSSDDVLGAIKSKYKDQLDDLSVFARPKEKALVISMIKVKPEFRKQGIAKKVMKELLYFADSHEYVTILTPEPQDRSISQGNLEKFYKELGFVANKGKNKDWRFTQTMIRKFTPVESIDSIRNWD